MQLKKYFKPVLNLLTILFITFSLIEVIFFMFLKFPELNVIFPYLKNHVKEFYLNRDRKIVQLMPQCAEYDANLTYRLKEGGCIVTNREFSVKYEVNKVGVRDDNRSLEKPEVIVLGDSHAMGWGVDQDKIFPSLIEKNSKLKVLNAAISSYGTAREFLMLKQLDKSNLKYLVIQYSQNDDFENNGYMNNGYKMKISSKEKYQKAVQRHNDRVGYKPFRFTSVLLRDFSKLIRGKYMGRRDNGLKELEFPDLLKILNQISGIIGRDTKIILLEINESNTNRVNFSKLVSAGLIDIKFSNLKDKLIILDIAKLLKDEDYFILDDHMKESGHRKVANEILKTMKN